MSSFSVMDLWGGKYYGYEPSEKTDAIKSDELKLPLILISPDSSSNKQPYVIDSEHIVLDDLIIKDAQGFSIDASKAADLRKILALSGSDREDTESLRNWFRAVFLPLAGKKIDKTEKLVIPVPDRLPADFQNKLIKAATDGLHKTPVLLWRSVAAFLGNAERIQKEFSEHEKVAVVDIEPTGTTISYLWIEECDGFWIPAHRLFLNSDTGYVRSENYPFNRVLKADVLKPQIPYEIKAGMLQPASERAIAPIDPLYGIRLLSNTGITTVIAVGNLSSEVRDTLKRWFENPIIDTTGDSIAYGAACFANCMEHEITAYFDECEALSLVVADRSERYHFKTLIEADQRLRSSKRIVGKTVDGIYLHPETKNVEFYLRLGEQKRNAPLKSLFQSFDIPDELRKEIHGKTIELELQPSLIPGQGRASVDIVAKDHKYETIFRGLQLDWEKMEDSDKTLETLESEMERSFPPDIPYVRKKSGYLTDSVYLPIRCFILNNAFLQGADINKSVWAHPAAKDITRFERYNTFGVPTEDDDGLPEDPDQKETCLKFLNTIDERFEVAHSSDLITLAAWTYHPLQVPHVTEYVRKYIRDLGQRCSTKYFKLDAGKASFCANMFTSQDDGVLFMKAFFRKLSTGSFEQGVSGANHWYRAAYQIMMSNPDVFEILAQDLSQIYTTLNMLISSYYSSQSGSGIRSNICKILCFMMKLRSVYSEFCKQDENDVITVDGSYYILLNMLSSNGTEPVRLFIDRYISLLNISDYKDSEVLLIYKAIGLKLSQRQAFEKCFYQYLSESVLMNVGLLHDESVLRNIARRNDSCFGDVKRWGSILNLYLNGKGNLNIPTADL